MEMLIVDFNRQDESGLVPALLPPGHHVHPGTKLFAADGEGTECQAEVVDISGRIAMLSPIGGTWNRDSEFRLSERTFA